MLKKVIDQLNGEQYNELRRELSDHRGEKFSRLLELYRESPSGDADFRKEVGVNQAAFYTLKSRLFDKVQHYLFRTASDNRAELLKNISSIPHLVYSTPRETAISLLEHLESELKKLDMPSELVSVYNALKKLHLHTEHFYHYQQLYNKNVAYTLALDKADELVSLFTRELGDYLLSHDEAKRDILKLYLRELTNLSKLYDSHRLKVSRAIVGISYALFADEKNDIPETDETIEDLLKQFQTILGDHPEDRHYRFLGQAWHFLNFSYYHRLGLHRNAAPSHEKLNGALDMFLLLAHTCPASLFMLLRWEHQLTAGKDERMEQETLMYQPEPRDAFTFVNFHLCSAVSAFHAKKYADAASSLNHLVNELSFKNYPFAELQVKLFLTFNLLLAGKTEQAEVTLRSISRKLAADGLGDRFPAANAFCKFLKVALNDNTAQKLKKVEQAFGTFRQVNVGPAAILRFAPAEAEHLVLLAR